MLVHHFIISHGPGLHRVRAVEEVTIMCDAREKFRVNALPLPSLPAVTVVYTWRTTNRMAVRSRSKWQVALQVQNNYWGLHLQIRIFFLQTI